jgi:acetyl-CoA carboxylase biotin carboxyl carrier protein
MSTTTPIDSDLIRTLATLLDETKLSEIEYDAGGIRIRVARQTTTIHAPAHAPQAAPVPTAVSVGASAHDDVAAHPGAVTSPMVGVAYLSPEPGSAPFAVVGATVTQGQTLLLIEAMKTFNPIVAPKSGKLTRVLVTDGHPVEFGEALAIIE